MQCRGVPIQMPLLQTNTWFPEERLYPKLQAYCTCTPGKRAKMCALSVGSGGVPQETGGECRGWLVRARELWRRKNIL